MDFRLKLLAGTLAFALSAASHAADPIKIGVAGPHRGSSSMGVSMRDGVPGDRGNQQERRRAGPPAGRGGARRRGQERARRTDRPGADQQGTGHRHRRLHQYRRGPGLAALLPDAKIPVFNNVATGSVITHQFKAPEYPDNYVFRNAAHDSIQAPMIVEEAITRRGFKKVAIWPTPPTMASSAARTWKRPWPPRASSRWPWRSSTSRTWT